MPSVITLDGLGRQRKIRLFGPVGDAWSDEEAAAAPSASGEFLGAFVGFGVMAFAVATAVIRGGRFAKRYV